MEGKPDSELHAGVIPRSIHYIFDSLEKSSSEYTVRVSHMELYNEELRDLLSTENKPLRIYDGMMVDVTGKKGCTVNNLEEVIVSNAKSIFSVIENSCRKRQTAETLLNPYSSRSNCIFTITIHTKEATPDGEDLLKVGKLNLVDLAGSENIQRSGAAGDRRREAGVINTSLLTLGRVINALTEHSSHIPYRESKLTRLLQDSLGGKTKTCIIATISPAAGSMEETLSTLDYAYRAKNIRNRPEVNQKMTRKALIKEYISEIEKLKVLLQASRDKNGVYVPTDTFESMETELTLRRAQVGDVEQILEKREAELEVLKATIGEKVVEIEAKEKLILLSKEELESTTHQFNLTKDSLYHTQKQLTTHKSYENALLSNLDASLHDREQLFNKIDRKKTVESANKSSMELARQVLLEKVKYLENSLGAAHTTQSTFFSEMEESLSKFQQQKEEHVQALGHQSQQLENFVATATNKLDACAREIQSSTTNALTSLSASAQQHCGAWREDANEFYQDSHNAIETMQAIIAKQSAETTQWVVTMMTSLRLHATQTRSFLEHQSDSLRKLSEETATIMSQQQKHTLGRKDDLNKMVNNQLDEMNAWQSNFLKQVGSMIHTEVSRQGEKLKSQMAVITSGMDTDMSDMECLQNGVKRAVDDSINHFNQYCVQSNLLDDKCNTEECLFIEKQKAATSDFTNTSAQFESRATEYRLLCDVRFRDHTDEISKKSTEALSTTTALHHQHQTQLQTEFDEHFKEWCKNTSNENTDFQNHTNAYTSFCTNQIGLVNTHAIQTQMEAQSLLCDLSKKVTATYLLKEDIPTGVTPIKKSIPIPLLGEFGTPTTNRPLSSTQLTPTHTPTRTTPNLPSQPPRSQPPDLQPRPEINVPQTSSTTPTPFVLNTQPPSADTDDTRLTKRQHTLPNPPSVNLNLPSNNSPANPPHTTNSLPANPTPATPLPIPASIPVGQQPPNAPASKHSRIPKMVADKKSQKNSNKENVPNGK
eukprot:Phypoly_transcript_00639.p1 GENE.Phypoly_transcript_00639~~Phypoly_transcript_00639.p1  ORF type:complete len:1065 (+),score=165.20 Phypoly_transcript_00639:219-3197(+)